jgi:NAD(P)-dependent dehydrogenase (short-subunit alcohol dehydrogenase family)
LRHILVTGANRGIGLEFVRQYAADGYKVTATCRDPSRAWDLRRVAGDVEIATLDITSADEIATLARDLAGVSIDILVGNAAVFGGSRSRFDDIDWDTWRHVFDVNVVGTARVAVELWRNVAQSAERKIVLLSSRAGLPREAKAGASYAYRASKAALNAAGRHLALDLAEHGVIVAILNPGHVRSGIGGRNAPMSPAESVARMRGVIASLTAGHAGRFWHFDGAEIPL